MWNTYTFCNDDCSIKINDVHLWFIDLVAFTAKKEAVDDSNAIRIHCCYLLTSVTPVLIGYCRFF